MSVMPFISLRKLDYSFELSFFYILVKCTNSKQEIPATYLSSPTNHNLLQYVICLPGYYGKLMCQMFQDSIKWGAIIPTSSKFPHHLLLALEPISCNLNFCCCFNDHHRPLSVPVVTNKFKMFFYYSRFFKFKIFTPCISHIMTKFN